LCRLTCDPNSNKEEKGKEEGEGEEEIQYLRRKSPEFKCCKYELEKMALGPLLKLLQSSHVLCLGLDFFYCVFLTLA